MFLISLKKAADRGSLFSDGPYIPPIIVLDPFISYTADAKYPASCVSLLLSSMILC
jgi:hypothetical protein